MATRGESVLKKLERLTGAPREAFLKKWVRWVKDLIPPKTDPSVIVGDPTVTEDTVIKLFREYCPDLEESECYNKLAEMFLHSKTTGRNVFQRDFIADFEVKSKISEAVTKALKLDFEINPAVADQLYRAVFEERNAERACELVKEDIKKRWLLLDVEPPAEELKLAEGTCNRIKELVARRAPPVEWFTVLEPVYRTREEIDPSIKPYIAKIKEWRIHEDMELIVRRAKPEDVIIIIGDASIKRTIPTLTVRFVEDMKPSDLLNKSVLEERFRTKVSIHASIQAKLANEFIYVNKFFKDKREIPILCVYVKPQDFIVACDRPAVLIFYDRDVTRVIPITITKMVKELFRRGILVEVKA